MGVYKLEVVKELVASPGGYNWRNVYHLNTPTIDDAYGVASLVVDYEVGLHSTDVQFLKYQVSDPSKVEAPRNNPLSNQGSRVAVGAIIPPWNVVSVTFTNTAGGRPERKYYRVGLGEGDIVGSVLESAMRLTMISLTDVLVADVIALCSPDGNTITSGMVQAPIGMRQLHWHRKSRPGFHRGYVPNA